MKSTTPVQKSKSASRACGTANHGSLLIVAIVFASIPWLQTRDAASADDYDVGIDGNDNYTVIAPEGSFCAHKVAQSALKYSDQISLSWCGKKLAAGPPYTHIYVRFTPSENVRTILGNPKRAPHDNHMYLDVPDLDAAVGEALAHEIAHVVTRGLFPNAAPHWVMEGIACEYDGERARAPRTAFLKQRLASGQLPSLRPLLDGRPFPASDVRSYALAESLTRYLLTRGDRRQFVTFAQRLATHGVNEALGDYGIASADQLQSLWEAWVREKYAPGTTERS